MTKRKVVLIAISAAIAVAGICIGMYIVGKNISASAPTATPEATATPTAMPTATPTATTSPKYPSCAASGNRCTSPGCSRRNTACPPGNTQSRQRKHDTLPSASSDGFSYALRRASSIIFRNMLRMLTHRVSAPMAVRPKTRGSTFKSGAVSLPL